MSKEPPLQCQGKAARGVGHIIGKRCRNPVSPGFNFCEAHVYQGLYRNTVKMPSVYNRALTKTLAESINTLQAAPPAKQLQIFDELALMRDVATEAVKLYSIAREASAAAPDNMKLTEQVLAMGAVMREHLNEVVKLCEAAARMEQQAKEKISVPQLHFFVDQLVHAIYLACEGDVIMAKHIEQSIRTNVLLPSMSAGDQGTLLTPDLDVQAMDATVPKITDV